MPTVKTTITPTSLESFPRGNTPLLIVPVTVSRVAANLTGYTGHITFNLSPNPPDNSNAFLHDVMVTSVADTLGLGITGYLYYQFTNAVTTNFVSGTTYYYDIVITKSPENINTFTIAKGTFIPLPAVNASTN